jgi:glycosyltransferase involved in cell wall biosynthesis
MTELSFVIPTIGDADSRINQIIDSIEKQNIPNYEIIIVGGGAESIIRTNTTHIPITTELDNLSRKKNIGIAASKYDTLVIMHDYHVFDDSWYIEFEAFGQDWDICVHAVYHSKEQGHIRGNGWRACLIPQYPELPDAMCIPWDIDCLVPYMPIQGSYWVAKKHVMVAEPLSEQLMFNQGEDIEWSSRVIPGWLGILPITSKYKIAANPKCKVYLNKIKPTYPGNPDWAAMEKSFETLWDFLRLGGRRSGACYYDSKSNTVFFAE